MMRWCLNKWQWLATVIITRNRRLLFTILLSVSLVLHGLGQTPATTNTSPGAPQLAPAPPAYPITPPLTNSAAEALRLEAEKGDVAAQFRLGMLFASGTEAPQDLALAAAWLRKAAEQGNAAAQ